MTLPVVSVPTITSPLPTSIAARPTPALKHKQYYTHVQTHVNVRVHYCANEMTSVDYLCNYGVQIYPCHLIHLKTHK